MRNPTFLWIIVGIMLVLEIYVFQAVKMVLPVSSPRLRFTVIVIYWLLSVLMLGTLFALPYLNYESWPKPIRTYVTAIIVGAFFFSGGYVAFSCGRRHTPRCNVDNRENFQERYRRHHGPL